MYVGNVRIVPGGLQFAIFVEGFHKGCSQNFRVFLKPPPPLVTVTHQLILFLSSAFWGPLRMLFMKAPVAKGNL